MNAVYFYSKVVFFSDVFTNAVKQQLLEAVLGTYNLTKASLLLVSRRDWEVCVWYKDSNGLLVYIDIRERNVICSLVYNCEAER